MSLYEIATEYKQALESAFDIDEETGELLNNIDALSKLEGDLETKSINIASYIRNLEAEEMNIDMAIDLMERRRKSISNKLLNLCSYLKLSLEQSGIKEISKSPYFKIKIKTNPSSVFISDENLISKDFKITKEVVSINKSAIKSAIQNGVEVAGASLLQTTRIEIK